MSAGEAPSFCACLTEEFMNTVQRLPRSTGCSASRLIAAKLRMSVSMPAAKVCRKEPHPDEQASLTLMESMTPSTTRRYFMS